MKSFITAIFILSLLCLQCAIAQNNPIKSLPHIKLLDQKELSSQIIERTDINKEIEKVIIKLEQKAYTVKENSTILNLLHNAKLKNSQYPSQGVTIESINKDIATARLLLSEKLKADLFTNGPKVSNQLSEKSASSALTSQTVFSENFDGSFNWLADDENTSGTTAYWKPVDYSVAPLLWPLGHSGFKSAYCAGQGYYTSFGEPRYQPYMLSYMEPASYVDLTNYSSATLEFYYYLPSIDNRETGQIGWDDYFQVLIEDEVGNQTPVTWQNGEVATDVETSSWTYKSFTIPSGYVGKKIKPVFVFASDYMNQWEGVYVDDITITGTLIQFGITVSTTPSGRSIVVDGKSYTAPQTFTWDLGSSHSLNTTSPQSGTTGVQYVYSSWSDGGAQAHNYTVPSSNSTVTANFTTQYYLTVSSANGTTSGQGWYNNAASAYAGLSTGTASGGTGTQYLFSSWGTDASGSNYSQSNAIAMNGPKTANAIWTTQYYLTVNANTSQATASGQGWYNSGTTTAYAALNKGIFSGNTGVQYVFASWTTDAGGSNYNHSNTITMDRPKTADASWNTQYYLTMNAGTGGGVTPSSSWRNNGESVPINAPPSTGYNFNSWLGSGAGSYTGSNQSSNVTMNGPITQSATFIGPSKIALTSGNNQSNVVNNLLASPLTVTTTDANNNPVQGVSVTFALGTVPTGATGQTLSTTSTTTNASGQASTTLTLGNKTGGLHGNGDVNRTDGKSSDIYIDSKLWCRLKYRPDKRQQSIQYNQHGIITALCCNGNGCRR